MADYLVCGTDACGPENRQRIPSGHPSGWRLEKGAHGKPFFPDAPDICFSISHSGAFWVCAVAGQPVGADLQERRRKGERGSGPDRHYNMERIAERFFHPMEKAYLRRQASDASEQREKDFFDIWAAKESYVKYTGEGIGEGFGTFCVSDGKDVLSHVDAPSGPPAMLRHLPFDRAYSLCVCAKRIGEIEWRYL